MVNFFLCCGFINNNNINFKNMNNHWLYATLPEDEPQFECDECGKPIEKQGHCSNNCWEASQL